MSANGSSVNISQCPANVRYPPKADTETFGDANAVRRERVPYRRPFCQKFDRQPSQKTASKLDDCQKSNQQYLFTNTAWVTKCLVRVLPSVPAAMTMPSTAGSDTYCNH